MLHLCSEAMQRLFAHERVLLDVCFVCPAPGERHARAGGHPVPMALGPWIPAFAGMTRGHKHWQCMYEMDMLAIVLSLS